MTIHFQQLDSIPLAVVKRQANPAELPRLVPQCCGLVWNVVRAQRVPAGRHVAIYWDGTIRTEIGVELQGAFMDDGEVVRSATPAGLVAFATHRGPYQGLRAAHDAVKAWCRTNGHKLKGPSWEIYGHWVPEWDKDPSKIRTDVFWLVEG